MITFPSSLCLLSSILILAHQDGSSADKVNVAPGYYAFETARRIHGSPPRVRPPPYLPTDVPCPGVVKSGFVYSPKDSLCGDLNKGYIPRNPMGQMIHNQPYPFEMIKNKTLHFLAKALPYLKDDMDSIPKVVKLSKVTEVPKVDPSLHHQQQPHAPHGMIQQNPHQNNHGAHHQVMASGLSLTPAYYDYQHIKKRSVRGAGEHETPAHRQAAQERSFFSGNSNWNLTEARQKACEQKDGIMCQVMNSLNGNSLLTTLSQAAQVVSAAHSAATTAQSLGSLASLIHQFSSPSSSSPDPSSKSSIMSQLASVLSAVDGSSSSPVSSSPSTSGIETGSSNFNPVLAVLDYLASNSNDKSPISSLLPARRKKPLDLEELASEAVAAVSVNKVPPTPCPSLEEYIAPVFARNYQGVWKYIVQIPHEGYFTQTVQKTSCVKAKCDFMDGSCHESPRWVSLLVAEIFYPDARFPVPMNPNPLSMDNGFNQKFHIMPGNEFIPQQHPQQQQQQQQQPQQAHFPSLINRVGGGPNWRTVDGPEPDRSVRSDDHLAPGGSATSGRRMYRQMNSINSPDEAVNNDLDKNKNSNSNNPQKDEAECDGVDKVGCYMVRVYYDWFLVPGSCKCWKKNSQGSLDTLKKIFIGK